MGVHVSSVSSSFASFTTTGHKQFSNVGSSFENDSVPSSRVEFFYNSSWSLKSHMFLLEQFRCSFMTSLFPHISLFDSWKTIFGAVRVSTKLLSINYIMISDAQETLRIPIRRIFSCKGSVFLRAYICLSNSVRYWLSMRTDELNMRSKIGLGCSSSSSAFQLFTCRSLWMYLNCRPWKWWNQLEATKNARTSAREQLEPILLH